MIIAVTPQRIARVLPLLAAVCKKEPRPGSRKSPKIAVAKDEHLASHEKKPAASDGHHGIPHETDGRKRKVQFGKALPAAEAINDRGLVELARDGFQRRVKTESNIPDLARKDEQDGAKLDTELPVRKDRDHGEHDSRQETEHRDGLKNIQQRNQDHFGATGTGGDISVGESEYQAERVGHADSEERVQSVERENMWILRNLDAGMDRAKPGTANRVDSKNRRAHKKKNGDINQERPAPARARGPFHRRRDRRSVRG